METFKRVVSLLLCFVMLVGVVPFGAMATETTEPETTETTSTVEGTEVTETIGEEAGIVLQSEGEDEPISNSVTIDASVFETKEVFVPVTELTNNGQYLIVNTDKTQSLINNGGEDGSAGVTVQTGTVMVNGQTYSEYIENPDARAVWAARGTAGFTLSNDGDYLRPRNNSDMVSGTSGTWTYDATNKRLSGKDGSTTYYVRYTGSQWENTTTKSSVLLYQAVNGRVMISGRVTYTMQAPDALEYVVAAGTVAELTNYGLLANGTAADILPQDGSYAFTSMDTSIVTVDNNGKLTFTGKTGTTSVKIAYTWTDAAEGQVTVYKYVTINTREPSYGIEITANGNAVTNTIVIKGETAMNTGCDLDATFFYVGVDGRHDETIDTSKIRWESNKTNIATVDENGQVTFVGGEGNVIITVYYAYADGQTVTDEVTISVSKATYNVPDDGTNDFPEYPNQGSIRIDKTGVALGNFSQTGIAQMELSMTGVPYGTSVPTDIVIMVDMTSSMNENDITAAKLAVQELIETLVYDKENNAYDENMHLFVSSFSSGTSDKNIKIIDHLYDVTVESAAELTAAKNAITDSQNGFRDDRHSTTGTHYGVALSDVYATLNRAGHADNQFVIFLTDGEPNQYYYLNGNTYANYESSSHSNWFDTNGNVTSNFKTEYYTYLFKTEGIPVYTIGANLGSTSNASYLINHMSSNYSPDGKTATGETKYSFTCTTSGGITNEVLEIFRGIGESIREAAVDVVVEDKIADEYTMNFALPTNVTKDEAGTDSFYMQVVQYDLDENNEREANPDVIEKFLFNADGSVTHTIKGIACGNTCSHVTYSDGKVSSIKGTYFEYTRTVKADGTDEEFIKWTAEKLDRTELALQYFLYLDNSAGVAAADQVEPGTYNTNAYAHITYTNHLGNECRQYFPVPSLTWKGAKVTYVFYLVNAQGQPVNRAGKVIPFAEAIYVTDPVTYDVTWNELDGQENLLAANLIASANVPDVYSLYDADASYTVRVYETEGVDTDAKNGNYFQISGSTDKLIDSVMDSDTDVDNSTTKVFNTKAGQKYDKYGVYSAHPKETVLSTGSGTITTTVEADDIDYANTTVAFAVVWNKNLTPDTVVIDFGLDVVIDVYENDGLAATVVGVRAQAPNGIAPNSGRYTAAKAQSADVKIGDMKIGTASVENNTSVRFSLDKTNGMQMNAPAEFFYEAEVNYYEGNNLNTVNLYSSVTVIPATTIYYEDSFVDLTVWDIECNLLDEKWAVVGDVIDATQAQDRPGESQISMNLDADNVYGYDGAYENCSTFSMGSARKVTVNSDKFAEARFTFYGTGFDVLSYCSNATGTITVDVYYGTNVTYSSTNRAASYAVDTYYGMDENGNLSVNNPNALYQVPVMKVENLTYGQYTVVITAAYASLFDHNKVGSYDFYLDAIRIYDPANDGANSEVVEDAYKADGEGWPHYEELRNLVIDTALMDENSAEGATNTAINGVVFIDTVDGTSNIADYVSYGPNNELYLAPGQSIAFQLDQTYADKIADIQIAMKSANGNAVSYKMNNVVNSAETNVITGELNTATDLYYSIKTLKNNIIVISNVNKVETSAIISITNIKFTFTEKPSDNGEIESIVQVTKDMIEKVQAAMNAANKPSEEEKPEGDEPETKPDPFVPEIFEVKVTGKSVKAGQTINVKVTTSSDVVAITVEGEIVTQYKVDKKTGNRTWEAKILTDKNDAGRTETVEVVAYGEIDGNAVASEKKTVEVKIEAKPAPAKGKK